MSTSEKALFTLGEVILGTIALQSVIIALTYTYVF